MKHRKNVKKLIKKPRSIKQPNVINRKKQQNLRSSSIVKKNCRSKPKHKNHEFHETQKSSGSMFCLRKTDSIEIIENSTRTACGI